MNGFKTQHVPAGEGFGFMDYANQIVTPSGRAFTVNHQKVVTARKEKRTALGNGRVRRELLERTGNEPKPDPLCEFIAAACNAYGKPPDDI